MSAEQNDASAGQTLAALAIGLAVGFGLGVLFAPNSGRKTRAAIIKTANRGLDEIQDRVEDIRSSASNLYDSASDLLDKGLDTVQSQRDNVAKSIGHIKKAYRGVAG
jgi:gas vesicle protein